MNQLVMQPVVAGLDWLPWCHGQSTRSLRGYPPAPAGGLGLQRCENSPGDSNEEPSGEPQPWGPGFGSISVSPEGCFAGSLLV